MKAMTKWLAGAATVATLLVTAPASAQYYDYRYDRYGDRETVDAVVDGVARVAGAVAALRGSLERNAQSVQAVILLALLASAWAVWRKHPLGFLGGGAGPGLQLDGARPHVALGAVRPATIS